MVEWQMLYIVDHVTANMDHEFHNLSTSSQGYLLLKPEYSTHKWSWASQWLCYLDVGWLHFHPQEPQVSTLAQTNSFIAHE